LDQLLNVRRPVLTVGIERHDDVGSSLKCEVDPRLQCSTLTEIDRVSDEHMGRRRRLCGAVR